MQVKEGYELRPCTEKDEKDGLEAMGMCQYRTTAAAKESRWRTKACSQLDGHKHEDKPWPAQLPQQSTEQRNFLCSCCR